MTERYFKAAKKSPLHRELVRITEQRKSAVKDIEAFSKKHDMDVYGSTPLSFKPKSGKPKAGLWTKCGDFYRPNKATEQGKSLQKEIDALPDFPDPQDSVKVIAGIDPHMFVWNPPYMMRANIRYYDSETGLLFVRVPENKETGAFKPPVWLKEVKEWEVLKALDSAA